MAKPKKEIKVEKKVAKKESTQAEASIIKGFDPDMPENKQRWLR